MVRVFAQRLQLSQHSFKSPLAHGTIPETGMTDFADLEIALRRRDHERYQLEMVFAYPGNDVDIRPLDGKTILVHFPLAELRAAVNEPEVYGPLLGSMLLANEDAREGLAEARRIAEALGLPLRLRLAIASDAFELHDHYWEMLTLPGDALPVSMSAQVVFTRTVSSADWKQVKLRAKDQLRALVVISAPTNLADFGLAPIDLEAEHQRVISGLRAPISPTIHTAHEQTSLEAITASLREGYDIFYLVAHGTLTDDGPQLCLGDGHGRVAWSSGDALVARIADLVIRPRLIVISSCMSAGDRGQASIRAIGPRLAVAGVPAVLAMQSTIALETQAAFAPTFFRELARHGQVDLALSDARQQLAAFHDWWVPVLFTRQRQAKIWYVPGFDDPEDFGKWPTLLNAIHTGKCTPILGPGLLDSYIGSTRELARKLAEKHHFPLAPYARDDLPQVAQFLVVNQDRNFLQDELRATFLETLSTRTPLPPTEGRSVDELLSEVSASWRDKNPNEIHNVLASLPFPIYLTANPDALLIDALEAHGRHPYTQLCPWNDDSQHLQAEQDARKPPPLEPTSATPLVYRLFGRLDKPETLVITEDDYFSYLIGVTRNDELLPAVIDSALVNTALLFLGFRLDDWNFRVLFQSVVNLGGAARRDRYTHVAVQLDPQEEAFLNPAAARLFLKSRFGTDALKLTIFWGTAEDFVRMLVSRSNALKQSK